MQIERYRGDTGADEFTVLITSSQEAANITDCAFVMTLSTVANPIDNTTVVYQLNGAITDAPNGIVTFTPTLSQVNRVGYFYFDIQMTDSYAQVHTLTKGTYVYKQDITK
jgi:hypothetical protein